MVSIILHQINKLTCSASQFFSAAVNKYPVTIFLIILNLIQFCGCK
jgi:hypothetical protein